MLLRRRREYQCAWKERLTMPKTGILLKNLTPLPMAKASIDSLPSSRNAQPGNPRRQELLRISGAFILLASGLMGCARHESVSPVEASPRGSEQPTDRVKEVRMEVSKIAATIPSLRKNVMNAKSSEEIDQAAMKLTHALERIEQSNIQNPEDQRIEPKD